jgi:hypothetical protein
MPASEGIQWGNFGCQFGCQVRGIRGQSLRVPVWSEDWICMSLRWFHHSSVFAIMGFETPKSFRNKFAAPAGLWGPRRRRRWASTTISEIETYSQSSCSIPSFTMYAPFSGAGAFGANPSVSAQHSTVAPYTEQYNFAIEHQFPKGLDIHLGYVGQHSIHQNNSGGSPSPDINLPPPGPGVVQSRRPVQPFATNSLGFDPIYHSTMNSLQVGVHKRYSNGFMVSAEYQYVRILGLETFENPANIGDSYGNISGNTPHTLRVSYTYGLPFGKGKPLFSNVQGLADKLVSGWQLSGITSIQSGQPFFANYTAPGNPVGLVSGRANLVPGVPLYPANRTIAQWFTPAAFTAPPTSLTERPGTTCYGSPGFGTSTRTSRRTCASSRSTTFNFAAKPSTCSIILISVRPAPRSPTPRRSERFRHWPARIARSSLRSSSISKPSRLNKKDLTMRSIFAAILAIAVCASALGQSTHSNPWEPVDLGPLPPVASLTDGVWLKGDLHLHSRHSHDSSNNSGAKIISFAESVGFDYLCITDHDNHVQGDVAHHTWTDPEFTSKSVLLLYGAEWTTTRGHGNIFSARPYDQQRLYDVRDQRDIVIGAVKKELGVHLSPTIPAAKIILGSPTTWSIPSTSWALSPWPVVMASYLTSTLHLPRLARRRRAADSASARLQRPTADMRRVGL